MKKTFQLKSLLLSMAVAGSAAMAVMPATSQAGVSANIAGSSMYIFRGIDQNGEMASASAGLDYESDSGIYIGTWAAKVDTGLEYDIYGGWSGSFGDVSVGLGATAYRYTDAAFDKPYTEVNASLGYKMITVGYDKGYHEDSVADGSDADYDHKYVSVEYEGFAAKYGVYDPDVDVSDNANSYLDLGYSAELSPGLEGSVNYIFTTYEDSATKDTNYLVFGISKSFDIM